MMTCRFRVDRHEINYLSVIMASYDGIAVVRTIDAHLAVIEIWISPGCEGFVAELLESLGKDEDILLREVSNTYHENIY